MQQISFISNSYPIFSLEIYFLTCSPESVTLSDYDSHWLNKLPRILINVDRTHNPRQPNCRISSEVSQAVILMRRTESILPVQIFERNWL